MLYRREEELGKLSLSGFFSVFYIKIFPYKQIILS